MHGDQRAGSNKTHPQSLLKTRVLQFVRGDVRRLYSLLVSAASLDAAIARLGAPWLMSCMCVRTTIN